MPISDIDKLGLLPITVVKSEVVDQEIAETLLETTAFNTTGSLQNIVSNPGERQ